MPMLLLAPDFVAAVLEGFEGTLDEVVERVDSSELRADLKGLQAQISKLRASIEEQNTKMDG